MITSPCGNYEFVVHRLLDGRRFRDLNGLIPLDHQWLPRSDRLGEAVLVQPFDLIHGMRRVRAVAVHQLEHDVKKWPLPSRPRLHDKHVHVVDERYSISVEFLVLLCCGPSLHGRVLIERAAARERHEQGEENELSTVHGLSSLCLGKERR